MYFPIDSIQDFCVIWGINSNSRVPFFLWSESGFVCGNSFILSHAVRTSLVFCQWNIVHLKLMQYIYAKCRYNLNIQFIHIFIHYYSSWVTDQKMVWFESWCFHILYMESNLRNIFSGCSLTGNKLYSIRVKIWLSYSQRQIVLLYPQKPIQYSPFFHHPIIYLSDSNCLSLFSLPCRRVNVYMWCFWWQFSGVQKPSHSQLLPCYQSVYSPPWVFYPPRRSVLNTS